MKRNLKALGLALLAAFAMSTMVVSAAQAEEAKFTAAAYPTVLTGTEEGLTGSNYFDLPFGSKVHCEAVTYEATLTRESSELAVTPHYTGCVSTGLSLVYNFEQNGCYYRFTAGTKKAGGSTGSTHLVCPTGKEITVTMATCTIHIPPQTLGGGAGEITFTNKAGGTITLDTDITGKITSTETDGFLCPLAGNIHVTTGNWVGTITFQGFEDLGIHHAVTKDQNGNEHTITTGTEGATRNIDVG